MEFPVRIVLPALLVAFGSLSLSACDAVPLAPPASSSVFGINTLSLRLNANPEAPSAVTFAFNGGPNGGTLVAVTSPDAQRVEIHETRNENGMTAMAQLERLEVGPNTTIEPRERGLHLMLFGVSEEARQRGKVTLTFTFADGSTDTQETIGIERPGEASAGATDHSGH
jgi:periplasmic copper chaperone A